MCGKQPPEGERRSKKATARWYQAQSDQLLGGDEDGPWRGPSGWQGRSGWWPRFQVSEGLRLLLAGRPAAWARWVLVDLDQHEASCRWRRLVSGVTGVRSGRARS